MPKSSFDPQLRFARFLPRTSILKWNLGISRTMIAQLAKRPVRGVDIVSLDDGVSLRIWRPRVSVTSAPALLWIHGGGMVAGSAAQDDRLCRQLANDLAIVVASVEYRLAPEHPFPVPLDDCYQALSWLVRQPFLDNQRIAVGGASAGGGLAAALALMLRERGGPKLVGQVLAYPMLDDRTNLRNDIDPRKLRLWNQRSNRFGWRAYLGNCDPTSVPPLAAPARCLDLSGLPPTWIGVGTHDLFHDEDVEFAHRLAQDGVPCELLVVPGAYHGFDLVESKAPISQNFAAARSEFLKRVLLVDD